MMEARIRELLAELDRLVPSESAHVILHDDGENQGVLPFCATRDGFLRFGMAFMSAGLAEGEGRGANGGQKVPLDLDPLYRSDSNVEFACERVAAIPHEGDRRRPKEVPGPIGFPIVLFLLLCFVVGLYHVVVFVWSRF